METRIHRQSLLNSYAAADIDTTTLPGMVAIPGLNPIPASNIKNVVKKVAVSEVRQLVTFTLPTIVASTRYAVRGNELQAQGMDKEYNKLKNYATTSAAVLSGNATTDKVNVAWVIGWKIMQVAKTGKLNVQAGPTTTLVVSATAGWAAGTTLKGNVTGAKGVVATVTNGTTAVVIMLTTTVFTAGDNALIVNGATTAVTTTSATYTGNLAVLDDAGYFPAKGHRKGASSWVNGDNISTAPTTTTAAVYGFGQGTRMLEDVPVLDRNSPNLNSGIWNFATNNLPTAGKTYTRYIIVYDADAQMDSMTSVGAKIENAQAVWLEDSEADYAATDAALLAL
jgi:hypothetical protein